MKKECVCVRRKDPLLDAQGEEDEEVEGERQGSSWSVGAGAVLVCSGQSDTESLSALKAAGREGLGESLPRLGKT
jgi:hypothetical protein